MAVTGKPFAQSMPTLPGKSSASQETTPCLLCGIPIQFCNAWLLQQTSNRTAKGLGNPQLRRQVPERWALQWFTVSFSLLLVHLWAEYWELSPGSLFLSGFLWKWGWCHHPVPRVWAHSNHAGQRRRYAQKSLGPVSFMKVGRRERLFFPHGGYPYISINQRICT